MVKINILGTVYKLYIRTLKEDNKLSNKDGYCDTHKKEIVALKCIENKNDIDQCGNLIDYQNKIIRHEVIHAFLYESGLDINSNETDSWARNEEMVDWFAIQYPKIKKIYERLGV